MVLCILDGHGSHHRAQHQQSGYLHSGLACVVPRLGLSQHQPGARPCCSDVGCIETNIQQVNSQTHSIASCIIGLSLVLVNNLLVQLVCLPMSNVKHMTLSEGKANLQCTYIRSRADTGVTLTRLVRARQGGLTRNAKRANNIQCYADSACIYFEPN